MIGAIVLGAVTAESQAHGLSPRALEIGRPFGFPITNSMVVTWIVALALIVFARLATRNMKQVPDGLQNFADIHLGLWQNELHERELRRLRRTGLRGAGLEQGIGRQPTDIAVGGKLAPGPAFLVEFVDGDALAHQRFGIERGIRRGVASPATRSWGNWGAAAWASCTRRGR